MHCNSSRLCGSKFETTIGPILMLNVCMPTDYGDAKSLEFYIDCISNINA